MPQLCTEYQTCKAEAWRPIEQVVGSDSSTAAAKLVFHGLQNVGHNIKAGVEEL